MYLCEMTGAYSQVHGSPVLKALLFKSLRWISATTVHHELWAKSKT